MKILYIEDNETLAIVVCSLLKQHHYDVTYFDRGTAGIEKFREAPTYWDAVIVDLDLPDLPGRTLITEMAKTRPALPIVVYSGTGGLMQKLELYSMGASALLAKPCEAQDLLDVLKGLIDLPPEKIQ